MRENNNTLIHVKDLHKVFVTEEVETHALSGVHLDIKSGEYIAIAGPSGCGKSTLLSILGLLDSPEGRMRRGRCMRGSESGPQGFGPRGGAPPAN